MVLDFVGSWKKRLKLQQSDIGMKPIRTYPPARHAKRETFRGAAVECDFFLQCWKVAVVASPAENCKTAWLGTNTQHFRHNQRDSPAITLSKSCRLDPCDRDILKSDSSLCIALSLVPAPSSSLESSNPTTAASESGCLLFPACDARHRKIS